MTDNPPQDAPDDDVQWWSTPATSSPGAPGASATGADPTILGAGHQFGTSGQQFGASGYAQPYAQQPNSQQSYPQQTYAQTSYVQPTPGPQPVAQVQPGYTGQQYPQPPRRGNSALWIIGGVVGVVVIISVVLVAVTVHATHSATNSLLGTKKIDGNYAMSNVTNACSLVDLTVLSQWAPTPKPNPEHTEHAPDGTIGGGSLECNANYQGAGQYSTNGAEMDLDVEFQSSFGSPDYNMWKDEDTKTTGTGRDSGTLTDLGEQSYYATYEQDYSSFDVLEYTCATMDSNLSAKIRLRIESDNPASKNNVATTCKTQLKKVLTGLHK